MSGAVVLAAAAHKANAGALLSAIGGGLPAMSVILAIGAAAPNGRLKSSPNLRRPFGTAAVAAAVLGAVLLIVGVIVR